MMFFTESVNPGLLRILHQLMNNPGLTDFSLGGGTSLTLRYGHRKSVDLDLFSTHPFDTANLIELLKSQLSNLEIVNLTKGSICATADGYKLDFLHHPYPLIDELLVVDNIRFLSLPDLAAMKINAVTNRGSRKDFIDLLMLHENGIPLAKSLDYFCDKYGNARRFLAIRSLGWFGDTEGEPDPVFLNGWTWDSVRKGVESLVKEFLIQ